MSPIKNYAQQLSGFALAGNWNCELLCKVLTKNDDSGRHGVLIPEEAYSFFPLLPVEDPERNATGAFELVDVVAERRATTVGWKYYERYPERRITRLNPALNEPGPRVVVFLRVSPVDGPDQYFFDFGCSRADFDRLVTLCLRPSGVEPVPGAFVRIPIGERGFREDSALRKLLARFDSFRNEWVDGLRTGDTGLGYTFETLMGVDENNDKKADFLGIELKTKLKKTPNRAEGKTNLFQEAPEWLARMATRDRIRQIGKRNDEGRWTCYSAVTVEQNNLGLYLLPRDADSRVNLRKRDEPIGFWPYKTLEKRLAEKHSRAVFVKAEAGSERGRVRYRYGELVYCERPRVENFVQLVRSGDVLFEFTMSEKEDGTIRNHGYPWRLTSQSLLGQLFTLQVRLRD